jgi:chromosome segregation ATPase
MKRRRTSQWSTIAKLYNAGSLAERLDEQEELVATKEKHIADLQEVLDQKKSEAFEITKKLKSHGESLERIRGERSELRQTCQMHVKRLEEHQQEVNDYKERVEDLRQTCQAHDQTSTRSNDCGKRP